MSSHTLAALTALGLAFAGLAYAPSISAEARLVGDLPRGADLGFSTRAADGALEVAALAQDSAAHRAGLRDADIILAVQGETFERWYAGQDLLRRLDGDTEARLRIRRGGDEHTIVFTPPPRPLADVPGTDSEYGVVTTPDGARLRTITVVPEEADGPRPALFFTQWVSCDGVDLAVNDAGWGTVMHEVAARSGWVLLLAERASGGDSEGPACHELDYDTELAHYDYALDRMLEDERVDASRVVIWGSSLGSTLAPLLAQDRDVAGVMVSGAGALSYLERMIAFDRIGFERGDMDPAEINERMVDHVRFHLMYLIDGLDPEEIVARRPELAEVWSNMRGTQEGAHYFRPYDWHRQAAAKDFLGAWTEVTAPALVMVGEYDQFEYPHGHWLIADTLNELRPGQATYVSLPKMGHGTRVFADEDDAAAWRKGVFAPELATKPILQWLETL